MSSRVLIGTASRRATVTAGLMVMIGIACVGPSDLLADRSAVTPDPVNWRLKPTGIGPLRLGMSESRARKIAPGLRVRQFKFCDTWTVPGLDGVSLTAAHDRGGLSFASISGYSDEAPTGHGARGVEIGDRLRELKRKFRTRLKFVKRIRSLKKAFYRVRARRGPRALEFTVNTRSRRIEFEQAGFRGEFYYTDDVELCA